jgi:hypothetical protein
MERRQISVWPSRSGWCSPSSSSAPVSSR